MIQVKEAIIVEGRYDVNVLRQLVDATILETGGFRIFKDKERAKMIRKIGERNGLLILTDSDGAGLVIRNYLKGILPNDQIKHAYIPEIMGKERRKRHASKEGKLGVEGMPSNVLISVLQRAGATILIDKEQNTTCAKKRRITKADLFELGLSGGNESAQLRKKVLKKLELPVYLSTNALLDFLNATTDLDTLRLLSLE